MTGPSRTRSASTSAELPPLRSAWVRVVQGPDEGTLLALQNTPVRIGASSKCELRLSDPRVSRQHCEVTLRRNGFLLRDLGSRNGTFFNGAKVSEIALPPGALVRVGDSWVVLSGEHQGISLPLHPKSEFGELQGQSEVMRRLFTALEKAAAVDAPVLLTGETGVGKQRAARSLHAASPRSVEPFEVLECAAVSGELLQSALFGHERGAFTGATASRAGIFERAQAGTVLLAQIEELPLPLQPALLRVCESGEVARVGGSEVVRTRARIVATTRGDLAREVTAGRFREDLYYRLAVLPIRLPPLRERVEDLPLLCAALMRELGVDNPGPVDGPGLRALESHPWPGNVRELRNALARAIALLGKVPFRELAIALQPAETELVVEPASGGSFREQKERAVAAFERRFLTQLLEEHGGSVRAASRGSGIERTQLRRLLRKHGLSGRD